MHIAFYSEMPVQFGQRSHVTAQDRQMHNSRQLQNYKGLADPLKGDALNERVRSAAKDTMTVVYSAETITNAPSNQVFYPTLQARKWTLVSLESHSRIWKPVRWRFSSWRRRSVFKDDWIWQR